MLKSMTGFSRIESSNENLTVTVEIKSLNGRFLDINPKLPKILNQKEIEIRDVLKQTLQRGSVTININLKYETIAESLKFNEKMAIECLATLKQLNTKLKLRESVKLDHLLQYSDYFYEKSESSLSEEDWTLIKNAVVEATKALDKTRGVEGQYIQKDFQARIKKIEALGASIEAAGADRVPAEREKMRQRIAKLFESDEIDEQRLQMEMVMLANRLDISEECVRLKSHIKYFSELFKQKEPTGNKINFILQEMNREINTIGSKADDAVISQKVVAVKEELERIREQAQNVE